jgi:hypothetical protein
MFGILLSFVLLPRILGCWGPFARAFLPGRLVIRSAVAINHYLPRVVLLFDPRF